MLLIYTIITSMFVIILVTLSLKLEHIRSSCKYNQSLFSSGLGEYVNQLFTRVDKSVVMSPYSNFSLMKGIHLNMSNYRKDKENEMKSCVS